MNYPFRTKDTRRSRRSSLMSTVTAGASAILLVAGMAFVATSSASASPVTPHVTAPAPVCKLSIAAGTGAVVVTAAGTLIAGVTAGTTTVKFDCSYTGASTDPAIVVEASALAAAGTSNVIPAGLADTSAIAPFVKSTTDTGCPAATAGQCEIATFAVPATFTSAGDTNAVCPSSAAQINAGIFGCALAVATQAQAPVAGAEYLMQYASQTTLPNAPTITALQTKGSAGSQINVSDTAGSTGYWWGSGLQLVQSVITVTTPTAAPATCAAAGGYGNVPAVSPFLFTLWYPAGSTTPIPGSAAGVTISNDCYNGATLTPPSLGGTITVPASVTSGTTYMVYLCELNTTTYPSNDKNAACGTTGGSSWIDASFPFTATAGVISQNLPETATATATTSGTFTSQLVTSGGTGATTYTQTAGSPSIVVSSSGAVTTSGALAAGVYTASGTTKDTATGAGTFSFSLTVTAVVTPPPPVAKPKADKVIGEAIPGKTVTVSILGSGFTRGAKITGHAGTTATVLTTSGTHLSVRVKESISVKKGTYTFTIRFTSGKTATVKYLVK